MPIATPECGTLGGYQRHIRRNEVSCDDCNTANFQYHRAYRLATGRTKNIHVPVPFIAELLAVPAAYDILAKTLHPDVIKALQARETVE